MPIRAASYQSDGRGMQELLSAVWPLGPHPGGLGWLMATGQLGDRALVAVEDGDVIGWAALPGGGELMAQVEPGRDAAARELIGAALQLSGDKALRVAVTDLDETMRDALIAHDFLSGTETTEGMWMDAGAVPEETSAEYSVRAVRPDEAAARVAVHRAAWRPADMPWHPDHRPAVDAGATSSFSEEAYARCRATWLYDADLDLVVVAPDGAFAGSCLAWLDPSTGVAELEPMGIHPEHRRFGLAGLLCREVARRVAARGGVEVFINAGWPDGYPAPRAAYTKVGFRTVKRGNVYARPASS